MRRPLLLLATLIPSVSFAQSVDVPLRNWTVPPYRASSASGGLSPMTDISPGIGFVAVTPCRIADTRGLGFTGQAGPPLLDTGTRTFQITGTVIGVPAQCGIPTGADAVSFQFTIVSPNSNGNLIAWPAGGAIPTISILNWSVGETALGNGTIVPVSAAGALSVRINAAVGNATGHLVIDVNGYFTDQYSPGVSFHAVSNSPAPAILAENTSTASEAVAIQAVITTTTPGPTGVAAVKGFNQGTNATGVGVWGKHNGGGWGVLGESTSGFGVVATAGGTGENAAVYARNASTGVASGVFGWANSSGVRNYGLLGWTDSTQLGAAGVYGQDGSGPTGTEDDYVSAGVRGESNSWVGVRGVTGPSGGAGVVGAIAGTGVAGLLGVNTSTDYGVFSQGPAYVSGNLTVTGTISAAMKPFIQPHPFDPSKQIRYVSLEGPHSEVYFRGTAQVSQGVTRISIPEDFRLVASRDTYSTLVTPVGGMATVAVISEGEDGIVIQASRNVKVHYVVYAEREVMKNPHPIIENVDFRPNPEEEPSGYPDSYRRLMIQNGTLNPDGTVNMETARRLGWEKKWEKRGRPAPQPAE